MFQFLIGRLETESGWGTSGLAREFQFLIGRLETKMSKTRMTMYKGFQFLIGRLETHEPTEALRPGL